MNECAKKECKYNLEGNCSFCGNFCPLDDEKEIKFSMMITDELKERMPEVDIYIKANLVRTMTDYMFEHFDEMFEYSIQPDIERKLEIHSVKLKYIKAEGNYEGFSKH